MNIDTIPYIGEALAFTVAIVWASAVILFKKSGETVDPIGLNFFKNSLAFVLFIPTIWLAGETIFYSAPVEDYWLLFLSGALGIGVADTLFFSCLNRLGASLTAIVDCFYSPCMIGLSFLFLGEQLTVVQLIGAILIISAIVTATRRKGVEHLSRKDVIIGVTYGFLAMFIMAVGVIIAKPFLDTQPFFWVTEVRLLGGVVILLPVLMFHSRRKDILRSLKAPKGRIYLWLGSFVGAYLSMILWLGGMKYAQVSTAAALNQTNNIFIFIFAAIFLKEKINLQKTIGIILAIIGAVLVTFG